MTQSSRARRHAVASAAAALLSFRRARLRRGRSEADRHDRRHAARGVRRRRDRGRPRRRAHRARHAARQLPHAALRGAGRHDVGARQVLLGERSRRLDRRPRALGRAHEEQGVGRAGVPRLGRLESPRRDDHAAGLLDRGAVRGRAEGPRARPNDARLPARPAPGGNVGGRARHRRDRGRAPRTPTTPSTSASRSSCARTRRSTRIRTCPPSTTRRRRTPRPAGTRATCTSTPSTRRSATRR